jgi:hypothetical protein
MGLDYCSALAKLRNDSLRERGLIQFDSLLVFSGTTIIERYRMMAVYCYAKTHIPDDYITTVKQLWAERVTVPPREEFEMVMYYSSLLLATEAFGDNQRWQNGRSTEENHRDAKSFLLQWMNDVCHLGQQTFDSPTYAGPMFISMQLIHEFSTDELLRNKAAVLRSWLLADFAADYLEGQYVGAHARENMYSAMQPLVSDMSSIGWLYFGDGIQLYGREQYLAAISSYKVEPEIVDLALDRKKPFESFETKRSIDRVRGNTPRSYPIQKYTYMDPLYAVGSIAGGQHSLSEQHSWDVTWITKRGNSSLFTMHPYASSSSIAEFRPFVDDEAYKFYSAEDQFYATPTKTVGGSPYESIFQNKNTVIALYDIPDKLLRFPFMVAYLPLNPKKLDIDSNRTGWITMDVGDVYIAYYPFKEYNIFPEQNGQRLYSRGGKNGAVVQVAGKNVIGAYKSFRSKIRKSKVDLSKFETDGTVTYKTIFGEKLQFSYGKEGTVNGKAREFPEGMLFSSPKLHCIAGSGVLTIESKTSILTLDINRSLVSSSQKVK